MNPNLLKSIMAIHSLKREFQIVSLTFILLFTIPIFSIFILTNAGIQIVSDQLVSQDTHTHNVDIHDPITGKVIATVPITSTWPLHGVVTLEFGANDLPYQPLHTGIDIANVEGTPIVAAISGTVIYSDEINWGYGNHIVIDNGNNIVSLYGHLSERNVQKGDKVVAGQTIIGKEGETGWATGPHLHFEIDVFNIPVNPRTFIEGDP